LFRRVLPVVAGGLLAWYAVGSYLSPGPNEPKGACSQPDSVRCTICTALGRNDCGGRPLAGCPATAIEYINGFPNFRDKLKQQQDKVSKWTDFRRRMEEAQKKGSVELCGNLNGMKQTEAEIPLTDACPGIADGASRSSGGANDGDIAMLMRFRDCSEAKSKELTDRIKQRKSLRVGEETSQLHSQVKDVTKVHTDSIELLLQFREQANEARQVKCWLRGRIRDCGL
jgi:hypothetical protein